MVSPRPKKTTATPMSWQSTATIQHSLVDNNNGW